MSGGWRWRIWSARRRASTTGGAGDGLRGTSRATFRPPPQRLRGHQVLVAAAVGGVGGGPRRIEPPPPFLGAGELLSRVAEQQPHGPFGPVSPLQHPDAPVQKGHA